MNIFVTGANSMLGENLVFELLNQNHNVLGLIRNDKNNFNFDHPRLQILNKELKNIELKDIANIECIIHIASETNQGLFDYKIYKNTNVEGSKHVIDIAIKNKSNKFIYISTANTINRNYYSTKRSLMNLNLQTTKLSYYAKSKIEAENYILGKKSKIDVIILNPTFIIGSLGSNVTSKEIINRGLKKIVFYPGGGKNFVGVKDVVSGIINSIKYGKNGEKYLLANQNLSFKEIFDVINKDAIKLKIPNLFMYFIGLLGNLGLKLRINNKFHLINMKMLCINNFYDNKKSISALKLKYNPINDAISEAIS